MTWSQVKPSKASPAFQLPSTTRETEATEKEDLLMGLILLFLIQASLGPTRDDFIFYIFNFVCV